MFAENQITMHRMTCELHLADQHTTYEGYPESKDTTWKIREITADNPAHSPDLAPKQFPFFFCI
jgi:hypothetical protein